MTDLIKAAMIFVGDRFVADAPTPITLPRVPRRDERHAPLAMSWTLDATTVETMRHLGLLDRDNVPLRFVATIMHADAPSVSQVEVTLTGCHQTPEPGSWLPSAPRELIEIASSIHHFILVLNGETVSEIDIHRGVHRVAGTDRTARRHAPIF